MTSREGVLSPFLRAQYIQRGNPIKRRIHNERERERADAYKFAHFNIYSPDVIKIARLA